MVTSVGGWECTQKQMFEQTEDVKDVEHVCLFFCTWDSLERTMRKDRTTNRLWCLRHCKRSPLPVFTPRSSDQECCLAQPLRKDSLRDPGPPSGHTRFLFQQASCTRKSIALLALLALFVTSIWMGRRVVEDVVALRALPGQNPGPGERGGGWDTNKGSGWDDKSQTFFVFFIWWLKTLQEGFIWKLNFSHCARPHADGKSTELLWSYETCYKTQI